MSRPASPPLFSPTHRPMLVTSASFRTERAGSPTHSPARSRTHSSAHGSASAPNTGVMLHEDPWQVDVVGGPLERPLGTSRSLSEGHTIGPDPKSWLHPLIEQDNNTASTSLEAPDLYQNHPAAASNTALDLTKSMRDSVDLTIPREADVKGKGKAKEVRRESTSLVERVMVWSSMVETSNGRDKILKCAQYSARTYLYLNVLVGMIRKAPPAQRRHFDKLRSMVSGLSLTRKCLLLLNFLAPLSHLLSNKPLSGPTFFTHTLSLLNGLADDVFCLSRLGIVGKRRGKWADKWSNRLWLLTSLISLSKLYSTQLPLFNPLIVHSGKDQVEDKAFREAQWTARKLLCDVVFASYDVFSLSFLKEPVLCAMGLTAAYISTTKLYDKHTVKVRKELSLA